MSIVAYLGFAHGARRRDARFWDSVADRCEELLAIYDIMIDPMDQTPNIRQRRSELMEARDRARHRADLLWRRR